MSNNENTLEEKIFTVAILSFFVCLGYFFRMFIDLAIIDGLMTIVAICLGSLIIIGTVLLQFD